MGVGPLVLHAIVFVDAGAVEKFVHHWISIHVKVQVRLP
jgi:predicted PilT family ATPase